MTQFEVHNFLSFNLSIILLFIGKAALGRSAFLRRYSIPEPVIGGFLCATAVGVLYFAADLEVVFDLEIRDWLLVYFFAGIGLRDLRINKVPLILGGSFGKHSTTLL